MTNKIVLTRIIISVYSLTSIYIILQLFFNKANVNINLSLLLLTSATFIPLLMKIRSKNNVEIFEPIYGYTFIFYMFYILGSLIVYNTSVFDTSRKPLNVYNESQICPILISLSAGISLFHLGYFLNSYNTKKTEITLRNDIFKFNPIISFLYLISISFRIYGYSTGQLGSLAAISGASINIPFASIFYFISNIWFVYFAYYSACHFYYKKFSLFFYFALLFEIVIVLISGDRRYIVEIFLIAFGFYYDKTKYIPWKKVFIVLVLFLFVFWPIVTVYGQLLEATNDFGAAVNQFDLVLSLLQTTSITELLDNILNSTVSSLFFLSDCQTAYVNFDLEGTNWGPVGLQNLLNNLVPSSFISRLDVRQYYDIFAVYSLGRSVDYSWLTFMSAPEAIISFGLFFMPLVFFVRGYFSSSIFKYLYTKNSFSKVMYYALFFTLIYSFHCGLLTSELVTPLRVYIYYRIIVFLLNARKPGKAVSI